MSVNQTSDQNVIGPRVMWQKMLDRAITKYEYRFTTEQVEDLLDDEEEQI